MPPDAAGTASRKTTMIDDDKNETITSLLHTIALIREAAGVGEKPMLSELPDVIRKLRKERDEAWLEKGRIMNEIDCRIEHGADSNGHLEAIRKLFSKQALEKMTRLDEEMGLLWMIIFYLFLCLNF